MNSCAEETRPILVSFIELSGVCSHSGALQLPAMTDTVDAQCPLVRPFPLVLNSPHIVFSFYHSHYLSQLRQLTILHTLGN
jgi:hypothetical protein